MSTKYEAKIHGGTAEDEARLDALANFEADLDDLITKGRHEAYRVGGTFRGPGIVAEMNKLMRIAISKS